MTDNNNSTVDIDTQSYNIIEFEHIYDAVLDNASNIFKENNKKNNFIIFDSAKFIYNILVKTPFPKK
jgi:hypothetical protein